MIHQRLLRLRPPVHVRWEELGADLEAAASAWSDNDGFTDLQLVRLDDSQALLVLSGHDDGVLARVTTTHIEPWLAKHGLAGTVSREHGEVIASLQRIRADTQARFDRLDDAARREHFVDAVVASGQVWGLYDDTWARSTAAGEAEALPFWPERRHATRCVAGDWGSFAPRSIELDAFIEQWLVGMHEDGIVAVLHPTPSTPGVVVPAVVLAAEVLQARADADDS
jgi:hypothetical protein